MLGQECLGAHHGLPDVPLGPLPDLNSKLIGPGVQISLHPEVDSRLLLGMFIILIAIEFSNLTARVEWRYEGWVLMPGPVLDGEYERILWELLRTVGECEVSVQAQPGVVEAKTHEREQEVDLLVDLRNGVPDVLLIVSNIVSSPSLDQCVCGDGLIIVLMCHLIKERVEFGLSDLVESVRSDDILRLATVFVSVRIRRRSISGCPRI